MKATHEIARIHAHICADGCVYMKKEKRSKRKLEKRFWSNPYENVWVIEYTNTARELLEEFDNDLKLAFNRKGQWSLKYYRVKITSVKWIIEKLELMNKNSYNWFIPSFIINSNKNIISTWIRAFFDDEATVTKDGAVRVKSMNRKGLVQIKHLLLLFNIQSSITGPNCDKSHYLYIYKRYSKVFSNEIGFNHKKKITELNKFIEKW